MNITDSIVANLSSFKLTLNDYLVLHCIKEGLEWHRDLKLDSEENYRRLVRRGYLDSSYSLTEQGSKLLVGQLEAIDKPKKRITAYLGVGNFDEFWEAFPTTDKYAHHPQTRVLRNDRIRTAVYYTRVIQDGNISHEQLMECLKKDIEMRQRASLGGQNEFKYMPAISTWLNKKYYEAYLEESSKDTTTNGNTEYGGEIT